jgi:hypothetical protein
MSEHREPANADLYQAIRIWRWLSPPAGRYAVAYTPADGPNILFYYTNALYRVILWSQGCRKITSTV